MNRLRLLSSLAFVLVGAVAWGKHYSFVGGYPASGVSASRAKSVENGGAHVNATTTRKKAVMTSTAPVRVVMGRVTKVIDGDTVWFKPTDNRKSMKVRLNRIDAPEFDQPFGTNALQFLSKLVVGKEVEMRYAECDQHGRVLGTFYVKSGASTVDVNLTMVLNGMAWHYAHSDQTPAYIRAQERAQAAKVGLWVTGDAITPYRWRKRKSP